MQLSYFLAAQFLLIFSFATIKCNNINTYFSSVPAVECNFDESEAFRFFVDATGAAVVAEAPVVVVVVVINLPSLTNAPPAASGINPLPLMSAMPPSTYGYLDRSFVVACCRTDGAKIDEFDIVLLLLLPPPPIVKAFSDRP